MPHFKFRERLVESWEKQVVCKVSTVGPLLRHFLTHTCVWGLSDSTRTRRSLRHQRSHRKSHTGAQVNQKLFTGNLLSFIEVHCCMLFFSQMNGTLQWSIFSVWKVSCHAMFVPKDGGFLCFSDLPYRVKKCKSFSRKTSSTCLSLTFIVVS